LQEFSFTVRPGPAALRSPSFILLRSKMGWFHLGKVRRTRAVATFGIALDLYDVRRVQMNFALMEELAVKNGLYLAVSGDEVSSLSRLFFEIRTELLRANPELTEDYFVFRAFAPESDIPVQLGDGIATGFRLFHRTVPVGGFYSGLQEQEIFDLDIQSFIDGPVRYDPYGRCEYVVGDRQLLLYKVDRKRLEKCLGIDLVYNFVDEGRCVFVQYKCQGRDGKPYYFSADRNIGREMERMQNIPGCLACLNRARPLSELRLCACSAFVKLCRREVHMHHNVPRGSYYPLCIWSYMMAERAGQGIQVDSRPHLSNEVFNECVRGGLIGTSRSQTRSLQDLIDPSGGDERVRLVFEERRLGSAQMADA
jgi:hypothetical protein